MKKQEPIKLREDKAKIDQLYVSLNDVLPLLQKVWDNYKDVGYYDPETNIGTLINSNENLKNQYKMEMLKAELPATSKLAINYKEAVKMYDVPSTQLDQSISLAKDMLSRTGIDPRYFKVTKAGNVVVNKTTVDEYIDHNSVILRNNATIQIHSKMQDWIKLTVELNEMIMEIDPQKRIMYKLHPMRLPMWLDYDGENYEPNPSFLKRLDKKAALLEPDEVKA